MIHDFYYIILHYYLSLWRYNHILVSCVEPYYWFPNITSCVFWTSNSHQINTSWGRKQEHFVIWFPFLKWDWQIWILQLDDTRRNCKQTVRKKKEKKPWQANWAACWWPLLFAILHTFSIVSTKKQTNITSTNHIATRSHLFTIAIQLTHTLYSTPSWRNRRLRPQLQRSTWFWQDNHLPSLWNPPAKWTYSIPRYDCSSQTGTVLHFPNETCQEYIVIINNLEFVQRAKILRSENLFLSGACQFLGLWCTK